MTTPPTLATVARLAGVSVASVSRVLNRLPATPEMERRVHEAVQQLGYVPDAAARSLRARRTHQLAFAVPDIGNPTYVAMMHAIEATARASGYTLVLHSLGPEPDEAAKAVADLRRRYVDGLIITTVRFNDAYLRALFLASAPVVVTGAVPEGVPVDNVQSDSGLGIELAVEHLAAQGRRLIGMLNGPDDTAPGALRTEGFRRGLASAGLDPSLSPIVHAGDFSPAGGREGTETLLKAGTLDAIVCANDLLAVAAMRTLSEHGLHVPSDVALTGMDDTELAALSVPSLTSVSLRSAEQGRIAAELMLERLADPEIAPRRISIDPQLVIRESSAASRTRPNRRSDQRMGSRRRSVDRVS